MSEFDEELNKVFVKLGIDGMQAKPLAIEAIKQAVAKHIIGEDVELIVPLPGIDNHNAVQRHIGGNQVREQQRKKLRS